jgi:hypothetical protein
MEILGSSSQDSAQSGCTGLSGGAPDSVRCARLALVSRELDGGVRLKITGLSGEPTVGRANGRPSQRSAAQSARDAWPGQQSEGGTGLSGVHRIVSGAPTAPNPQRSAAPE